MIKLDLGCGADKKAGFIGLDVAALPGVDHVLDLAHEPFPFADNSVAEIFSSHFIEHIGAPNHLFQEISRVCVEGARIEFVMPHAFHNDGFLYTHISHLTENQWLYLCCNYRDEYVHLTRGRWLLREIYFVIYPRTALQLSLRGCSLKFAVKYLKNVVNEFGVVMEFRHDLATPATQPTWNISFARTAKRHKLATSLAPVTLVRLAIFMAKRFWGNATK